MHISELQFGMNVAMDFFSGRKKSDVGGLFLREVHQSFPTESSPSLP